MNDLHAAQQAPSPYGQMQQPSLSNSEKRVQIAVQLMYQLESLTKLLVLPELPELREVRKVAAKLAVTALEEVQSQFDSLREKSDA